MTAGSFGQVFPPWDSFSDSQSNSICSVVNAGNTELVVLRATGQMRVITGTDVTIQNLIVNGEGFVSFEGEPAGLLDFATDGDGFRTLWWLTLTGNVVELSGFTGEPAETNMTPDDFTDVPCDACDLWDDRSVCPDPDDPVVSICGTDVPLAASASLLCVFSLRFRRRRALG